MHSKFGKERVCTVRHESRIVTSNSATNASSQLPSAAAVAMAPRKRRGRSTSQAAAATTAAPSGSGSSSPLSPEGSKSNVAATVEGLDEDGGLVVKRQLAADDSDILSDGARAVEADFAGQGLQEGSAEDANKEENPHRKALMQAMREGEARVVAKGGYAKVYTNASVALHLYKELVDWAVTEVAVEHRRQAFLSAEGSSGEFGTSRSGPEQTTGDIGTANIELGVQTVANNGERSKKAGSRSALLYSDKNVNLECSNCGSNISAARYAQHMEKCLGRGGRVSSRAASARLRASAEKAEKEAEIDDVPFRRRRFSSGAAGDTAWEVGSGSGSGSGNGVNSKRRKMSPVPSGPPIATSATGSAAPRGGLPPSGRGRLPSQ